MNNDSQSGSVQADWSDTHVPNVNGLLSNESDGAKPKRNRYASDRLYTARHARLGFPRHLEQGYGTPFYSRRVFAISEEPRCCRSGAHWFHPGCDPWRG